MLILSFKVIAPGNGYLFKFLPVLTLILKGGNPNLVKSKIPSSGKSATPLKFQSLVWLFYFKSTL